MSARRLIRKSRIPSRPKRPPAWAVPLAILSTLGTVAAVYGFFLSRGRSAGALLIAMCGVALAVMSFAWSMPHRRSWIQARMRRRAAEGVGGVPLSLRLLVYVSRLAIYSLGFAALYLLFAERFGRPGVATYVYLFVTWVLGMLAADLFRIVPGRAVRKRKMGGMGHRAWTAMAWPPWRRVSMLLAGALIAAPGFAQWIHRAEGVVENALMASICMIAFVGIGASMIGAAALVNRRRVTPARRMSDVFR